MNIDEAYPTKYLAAVDVAEQPRKMAMDRVEIEEVGRQRDEKPVLYFKGESRGLVLNKTNKNVIAKAYGKETESWTGKEIVLFHAMVDFGGEMVESIRVRLPRTTPAPKPATQTHDELNPPEFTDEIPF
jgi:hypothetical protein